MSRKNFEGLQLKNRNRLCTSFLFRINFCLQYKASNSRGEKLHKVFRIWNNVESVIYTGGMKHIGTGSSQEISRMFPAQVRAMWEARIQTAIRPWTIILEAHSDSARRLD